jgi:hypothetical protein
VSRATRPHPEREDVQLSFRPQTLSQACKPSGSWSSCSSSASCNDMARFLPFFPAVNASWYASGQHTLPHWCLPHARWALHTLAQRYSSVSTGFCNSGSNRVVRYGSPQSRVVLSEVHRHVRGTGSRQDGHGPSWQGDWQACPHGSGLEHVLSQVGTRSVQEVRGDGKRVVRGVWPHGQVVTESGEEGQWGAPSETRWG